MLNLQSFFHFHLGRDRCCQHCTWGRGGLEHDPLYIMSQFQSCFVYLQSLFLPPLGFIEIASVVVSCEPLPQDAPVTSSGLVWALGRHLGICGDVPRVCQTRWLSFCCKSLMRYHDFWVRSLTVLVGSQNVYGTPLRPRTFIFLWACRAVGKAQTSKSVAPCQANGGRVFLTCHGAPGATFAKSLGGSDSTLGWFGGFPCCGFHCRKKKQCCQRKSLPQPTGGVYVFLEKPRVGGIRHPKLWSVSGETFLLSLSTRLSRRSRERVEVGGGSW